jgi:hypothetical protein
MIEMIKTDFGVFIGTFMMGSILVVVPLVILTIVHSEPDYYDDDEEEITDAALVLCQLRQIEKETAIRNEQRRSAYSLRSSTKRD